MQLSKSNLINRLLLLSFGILCVTGMISYEKLTSFYFKHNLLNVSLILEVLFFLLTVISIRSVNTNYRDLLLSSLIFIYIVYSFILSIFIKGYGIYDFLMIYKAFCYLGIFLIFKRNELINIQTLYWLFLFLCFATLIKYFSGVFFFSVPRPGLLYENNSELLLLIVLFFYLCSCHQKVQNNKVWFLLLLTIITILSGSRSASLILFATYIFSIRFSFGSFLFGLSIFFSLILFQYFSRGFGLEQVDRFRFLLDFWDIYSNASFYTMVFGTEPITPLPHEVCVKYSFYENLLSKNDTCFSVVFHSFIMRSLFDHGILWSIIIVFGYYSVISREISRNFALYILVIAFLNGLSVSSYNSIFLNIAILLILISRKNRFYKGFFMSEFNSHSSEPKEAFPYTSPQMK